MVAQYFDGEDSYIEFKMYILKIGIFFFYFANSFIWFSSLLFKILIYGNFEIIHIFIIK